MSSNTYNNEYLGFNGFVWWMGVVEDNNDPLKNDGQIFNSVFKQIKSLANKRIYNKIAYKWIGDELRRRGIQGATPANVHSFRKKAVKQR